MDIYRKSLLYAVWNKLYLTEILNNNKIRFDQDMSLGEDALFNITYLAESDFNLSVINRPLYHYVRRRNESLDQKYNPDFFDAQIKVFEALRKYGEKAGISKSDENALLFYYFNALVVALDNLYCNSKKFSEKEFKYKMKKMRKNPKYIQIIRQLTGCFKVICRMRYELIRRGGFAIDYQLREILKRKSGVK